MKTDAHNRQEVKTRRELDSGVLEDLRYLLVSVRPRPGIKQVDNYAVVFPDLSHFELTSLSPDRRRRLHAAAVARYEERERSRLPEADLEAVFSDLDFDRGAP